MVKAGIAIDDWKLDIFRRHLVGAGYQFTEDKLMHNAILLTVKTEDTAALAVVVRAANEEAARCDRDE